MVEELMQDVCRTVFPKRSGNFDSIFFYFVHPILLLILHPELFERIRRTKSWKRVRVAEGARLESVCMGNCTVSSNLTVSAKKSTDHSVLFLFIP